jgi:hypothetical protein
MSVFLGLSLEGPLSESEYLLRELRITWKTSGQNDICSTIEENYSLGKKTLIIVSQIDLVFNLISQSPKKSLVLLILSDEAYSMKAHKLARLDSVYAIMRNYSITSQTLRHYLTTAKSVFGQHWKSSNNRFFALIEIAYVLKLYTRNKFVMSKWQRLKKPVSILPLGYTNRFAKSFCSLMGISDKTSLLLNSRNSVSERTISISFSGTRGSLQRRSTIKFLREIPRTKIISTHNGWNGSESSGIDIEYCQILFSSLYCAALPGYISNESFRFYEALICGALPIRFYSSLGQGALDTTIDQYVPYATIIEDFEELIMITEAERREWVVKLTRGFGHAVEKNVTFLKEAQV